MKGKKLFNLISLVLVFSLVLSLTLINVSADEQTNPIPANTVTDEQSADTAEQDGIPVLDFDIDDNPQDRIYIDEEDYENGEYFICHIPPEGWDPVTASDREIAYYGLPERPKDEEELKEWIDLMSGVEIVNPGLRKIEGIMPSRPIKYNPNKPQSNNADLRASSADAYANYSGYLYNSAAYGINASWEVPSVSTTSKYMPALSAQWVGLGGFNSSSLAQIGTCDEITKNSNSHYIWYEILGTDLDEDRVEITEVPCSSNDKIFARVDVTKSGSSTYINFYIENATTKKSTTIKKKIKNYSGLIDTAEWVYERPMFSDGSLANLPKPTLSGNNRVYFGSCKYKTSEKGSYMTLTAQEGTMMNMVNPDTNNTLAETGSVNKSGTFIVNWKNYK